MIIPPKFTFNHLTIIFIDVLLTEIFIEEANTKLQNGAMKLFKHFFQTLN